jgi:hypothetical protein
MSENDNKEADTSEETEEESKKSKKPTRRTQAQVLQEALNLGPNDIPNVEKKLFIAKFIDYFKEETFDFVYKDSSIEFYKKEINNFFDNIDEKGIEEDKLLKKSFEDKKIMDIVENLKQRAEVVALNKGNIKKPVDKKLRTLRLLTTLPLFGVLIILMFLIPVELIWYIFPLVCLFCIIPQVIQGVLLRKWYQFKEENKSEFYTENRSDIMILQGYSAEVLDNVRKRMLELKIPLQIIKFTLHSRDYENLKLINQGSVRGTQQFIFEFMYPPDMEPFPIPRELIPEKPEKNFIILADIQAKDGVIEKYTPILKTPLAEQYNKLLNESDFEPAPKQFKEIIPSYIDEETGEVSEEMAIYCVCGKIAKIANVHICTWKNEFKFYLFESEQCKCGETLYILSLMDSKDQIPDELKELFSNQ